MEWRVMVQYSLGSMWFLLQGAWAPHRWNIALSVTFCLGRWESGRMGRSHWQQWWKQPNLSQQRTFYEVTNHPVQLQNWTFCYYFQVLQIETVSQATSTSTFSKEVVREETLPPVEEADGSLGEILRSDKVKSHLLNHFCAKIFFPKKFSPGNYFLRSCIQFPKKNLPPGKCWLWFFGKMNFLQKINSAKK